MRHAAFAAALALAAMQVRAHEPLTIDTHVDIPDTYMREARFDVGTDTALRVDLGKMAAWTRRSSSSTSSRGP